MMIGVVLFLSFLPGCLSFGSSAPLEACWTMFPLGHGTDAMTTTSPYTITVNATSYRPGDVIEVFLDTVPDVSPGITFFEGLMVQARRVDCKDTSYDIAVGEFTLQQHEDFIGLMNCNRNNASAVGHIAHDHIYNRTFYWHAPSPAVGHVYFRGTVARRQSTFWTNVASDIIKDETSLLPAEFCPTSRGETNLMQTSGVLVAVMFSMIVKLI